MPRIKTLDELSMNARSVGIHPDAFDSSSERKLNMILLSKFNIASAFLVAFSFAPLHAHAGLFDDEEARKAILSLDTKLNNVQNDIKNINVKMEAKSDKTSTLDLVNQNEQLQQEIAKLRGQIEVLANDLSGEQRRQKDFYVDLDTRLRKLEPQKITVDGKEANVEPTEQKSYEAAQALLKTGDYKNASISFSEFLRLYPESSYAASAQYALGITYYAQHDFKSALAPMQLLLKNYPDNPKAPDTLLNLASCYAELKDKVNAKKSLTILIAKYPESSAASTAKDRLKSMK